MESGAGPHPRTLVIARHFPPSVGGIQTFTEQLLRRLDPERIVLVTTQPEPEVQPSVTFPVVRTTLARLHAELPELVRASGCTAAWLPSATPYGGLAPLLKRSGIRWVVASTHGQELTWMRSAATRAALRSLLRHVDVVTYLGAHTGAHLRRLGGIRALRRLAGGVDGSEFPQRREIGPPGARHTVITVSRLVPRKGHDRLVAAWPSVLRRLPDAQLIVVGDGVLRAPLAALGLAPRLAGSIQVVGRLSRQELVSHLHRSDVFISPSRDFLLGTQVEGLGLSTLEAASTGLPVVVGRSGGSPDSLLPGRTGLLIDACLTLEISTALISLLLDQDRSRALGRAGARWVRERWTWESAARQLSGLLSSGPGHLPKMFWESSSGHNW